jgi:hypothetical protein
MAQTKADLQREIRLLRKQLVQMQGLLQQAAIKCENMQGAYDATVATDQAVRADLRRFKLPPISQHG